MMWQIYALCALSIAMIAICLYIRWQNKKIASQKLEIEFIRAEAKAVAEEMENADKRKKIEQANIRLNPNGVDDQLQSKGYFRED
ncbi:DUF2681 domain-containing protein [Pasteurella multocida]|uniref:DUF2681 domain-containing protein n=1 Tax=Pasteurella multocida TaxID=747 RepID=UPI00292D7B6B|nr:DUF2681 domain-containing protein [Pasteurella multocida]WNY75958.1 DUF2681 domain-containing protein [Pasteurella multocida]